MCITIRDKYNDIINQKTYETYEEAEIFIENSRSTGFNVDIDEENEDMKAKVTINYSVEVLVEAENEDAIHDFANEYTPMEVMQMVDGLSNLVEIRDYSISEVPEDWDVDIWI